MSFKVHNQERKIQMSLSWFRPDYQTWRWDTKGQGSKKPTTLPHHYKLWKDLISKHRNRQNLISTWSYFLLSVSLLASWGISEKWKMSLPTACLVVFLKWWKGNSGAKELLKHIVFILFFFFFCLFTYLREKHQFVVPLIYAFTGWFLYVLWLG